MGNKELLQYNNIIINDIINKSKKLVQTNGVLQGDPLSPLLFTIVTANDIQGFESQTVSSYMYTDDTIIVLRSNGNLQ
jgi:hypothetical protein